MSNPRFETSRRRILTWGASGIGTALVFASSASPAMANIRKQSEIELPVAERISPAYPLSDIKSSNGWPIEYEADSGGNIWTWTVPGTDCALSTRIGDVQIVFSHLIRRYHYEIDALRDGDLIGFKPHKNDTAGTESNHASGTAIDIRPGWYPQGVSGGYTTAQTKLVRQIISDFDGVLLWGGDLEVPDEAHFEIAVPSDDDRLASLSKMIRTADSNLGQGAGALGNS